MRFPEGEDWFACETLPVAGGQEAKLLFQQSLSSIATVWCGSLIQYIVGKAA